jgi:hypothetical protein
MNASKSKSSNSRSRKAKFPNRDQWRPGRGEGREPEQRRTKPVPIPEPGKWSEGIDAWIKEHGGETPGKENRRPRPYLDISAILAPQISAYGVGEAGIITVNVWNGGNVPSWSCYVEVYEGPGGYTTSLNGYVLKGQQIVNLHPGQHRDVSLPWVRGNTTGRIVAMVYDPILDPRGFTVVPQVDRHVVSIHYQNLA